MLAAWLTPITVAFCLGISAAPEPRATPPERDRDRMEARRQGPNRLDEALAKRVRNRSGLEDVEIDVRWPRGDEVLAACRIVGTGVGIWRRESQFRVPQTEVLSLVKTLQAARFGALPDAMGDEETGEKEQKGRITLSIGPMTKTVVQLSEGDQSPELQRIAAAVLSTCASRGPGGVRVSTFEDAFGKLSAGTVAPEALEIRIQRRTDHPGDAPAEDWFLRVSGRRVADRDRAPETRVASARELILEEKDYRDLVARLRESDLSTLPLALYAPQYTDVRIQVLNLVRHIQARPFTGMAPQTHGEKQRAFDRLFDALSALHRRTRAEGRAIPEQRQADGASAREGKAD